MKIYSFFFFLAVKYATPAAPKMANKPPSRGTPTLGGRPPTASTLLTERTVNIRRRIAKVQYFFIIHVFKSVFKNITFKNSEQIFHQRKHIVCQIEPYLYGSISHNLAENYVISLIHLK